MLKVIVNPSYQLYNSVLDTTDGNFQQTFEHAETRKMYSSRVRTIRLLALQDAHPVGTLQGMYTCKYGFGSRMLMGAVTGGVPIVSLAHNERRRVFQVLLNAMDGHAKKRRILEGMIYWPEQWGMLNLLHDLGYDHARTIFGININLSRTTKELWNSFSRNKRKNIRKAVKYELSIEKGNTKDDLLDFYHLLEASGKRGGFKPFPLRELVAIWTVYPKELVNLFFTKLRRKRVAGVLAIQHVKSVFAIAAGSLQELWFCRPNDFLHWKVMEWACHNGCLRYNMGALNYPIPNSDVDGLWRWKRGFHPFLEKFYNFRKIYAASMKQIASLLHKF